jgi:hypothetical protein
VVFALDVGEEEEGEGVDYVAKKNKSQSAAKPHQKTRVQNPRFQLTENITRLVHRKIEIKRLRRIKHAAGPFLLAPLLAHRHAAEEGIHPQHDEVHEEDVSRHGVDGFAQGWAVGGEDAPVEGEHAHFGQAHADVVEVV